MAKKVENKSFGAAAAAIKKQKLEAEAAIKGQTQRSDLDKVKVNLSLIRKNHERLKAEANRRGVTVSGLITLWIDENCAKNA